MDMDSSIPMPHEKVQAPFVVLGLLFVIAAGMSILPASWFGIQPQAHQYAPLNLESISQPENVASDTNHDGTISWKEYVASSLNLSPDAASTSLQADPESIAALNDPNNLTGSFSKNLYIAANALNQSGITDEDSKQKVINDLMAKETSKITAKIYTSADVILVPDSKTSMKDYGNGVASAMNKLITEKSIVQDLTSINGYLQTADATKLIPLQQNAVKVNSAIKKILALKVPSSAISSQVTVLNKLSEYEDTLLGLSVADTDALRATIAVKNYHDIVVNALRVYTVLGDYFDAKNITFSSSEPGYIFIVGYTGVTN